MAEPTEMQLSGVIFGPDPLRLRGWATLSSSLGGTSTHMLLLCAKENQAPLWFQKAPCSSWPFTSTSSTSGQRRQAASSRPSAGHQHGAASFPLAPLSLRGRDPLASCPSFLPRKEFAFSPAGCQLQGSLADTVLESPGAWAGLMCSMCGPVAVGGGRGAQKALEGWLCSPRTRASLLLECTQ